MYKLIAVFCVLALQSLTACGSDQSTRILALGDSYTIGTSVTYAERWPVLLAEHLQAQGIATQPPTIVARNGWTTGNLLAALDAKPVETDYDWVTLMIGVNNQFQGRSLAEYEQQLTALLSKAIDYAGKRPERVMVVSIPDWSASRFGRAAAAQVSPDIARFNHVLQAAVERVAAHFVNISGVVERARTDETYLASDGLHFSAKMHRLWVDLIAKQMIAEHKKAPN